MKFIYADSLDFVDPEYDFQADATRAGRDAYWGDAYAHELLGYAPYDGILVSRAIVGDHRLRGKYTDTQAMRFRRVGARKFLRLDKPDLAQTLLFGDCGAFSYASQPRPPYTPEDTVEFYADGSFTHGCSIDHIIFEFDADAKGMSGGSPQSRERFDITLELADAFLHRSRDLGPSFTPIGVVQGWSAPSKAEAARRLVAMGYRYLALGGLVPLKTSAIHQAVSAVHDAVGHVDDLRIHLLGFAKADQLAEFFRYPRLASFDTTSPLLRAFKDARRNYYLRNADGSIEYYTALRIPQALENAHLKRSAQMGQFRQEDLAAKEAAALSAVRSYACGDTSVDVALAALLDYSRAFLWKPTLTERDLSRHLATLRSHYARTLEDRPWRRCRCAVCDSLSVEVMLFRSSNRNKRRGIHNLAVFYEHLQELRRSC